MIYFPKCYIHKGTLLVMVMFLGIFLVLSHRIVAQVESKLLLCFSYSFKLTTTFRLPLS